MRKDKGGKTKEYRGRREEKGAKRMDERERKEKNEE